MDFQRAKEGFHLDLRKMFESGNGKKWPGSLRAVAASLLLGALYKENDSTSPGWFTLAPPGSAIVTS